MSKSIFSAPHFNDEAAAFAYIEAKLWANGRVCPHCGVVDRSGALKGKSNRIGLYKCYACRKPFTVKVGTIFEDSHIQLRDWLTAIQLICSSKKGISSNQLHRTLGITLKSAWFLSHRIREAMRDGALAIPFGSKGGAVESDETYMTRRRRKGEAPRHDAYKMKVLTLIDRDSKQAKSTVISNVRQDTIMRIVDANVSREARMMTDQARYYQYAFGEYASHEMVDHSKEEYVRGEVHTNTAEGYFSVFKKGMKAVYQHCEEKHLHRYLAEFDFRYNNRTALGVNDAPRADRALKGVVGKRLTYRTANAGF